MTRNNNANNKKSVRKEKQPQQSSRSSKNKTKDVDPSKREDFSSASSSSDEETSASRKLAAENALKNASSSKPLQKKARTFDENAMETEPTAQASLIPFAETTQDASSSSNAHPQLQPQQVTFTPEKPKISLRISSSSGSSPPNNNDASTKNTTRSIPSYPEIDSHFQTINNILPQIKLPS